MAAPNPTSAALTTDYIAAGVRRFVLFPTMAGAVPTSAEITAGKDYTQLVTGYDGFTYSVDDVDNATYGSIYNTTIPGTASSDSSSWTLKADKAGTNDPRAALTVGLQSYVAMFNEGIPNTGGFYDLWPVRIKSVYAMQVDRGALATIMCQFSIYAPPQLRLAIPSA